MTVVPSGPASGAGSGMPPAEMVRMRSADRTDGQVVVAGASRARGGAPRLHARAGAVSRQGLRPDVLARAFKRRVTVGGRRGIAATDHSSPRVERDKHMAMMGSGYERRQEPEAPAGPRLRVYELAKDLNVQPKDLLNKIRAMGIDVANHMSHLESVDVDRVRRAVERERQENLEEVRLNDTVIRRRSKSAAGRRARRAAGARRCAAPPAAAPRRAPRAPAAGRRRRRRSRPRSSRARAGRARPRGVAAGAAAPQAGRARGPPPAAPAPVAAPPASAAPPPPRRHVGPASRMSATAQPAPARRRPRRRRPAAGAQDHRAAGRHRLGGDGRVHPAARRAAARRRSRVPALRDQGSRRGAAAAGPRRADDAPARRGPQPVRAAGLRPRRGVPAASRRRASPPPARS